MLCVGHVHRERVWAEADDVHTDATDALVSSVRGWLRRGRSTSSDRKFLLSAQDEYEKWLPSWDRWNAHFRDFVSGLGLDKTQIAWANLAKCRVAIDQRSAVDRVIRLCQGEFPAADLVDAIRPVAVLVCVLHAGEAGPIVKSWKTENASPLVFTWDGRRQTNERGEKRDVWRPRAIRAIKKRFETS